MKKFENVDILDALHSIMQQNTAFHQDDFLIDEKILRIAAADHDRTGKTFLWLSRPNGTQCNPERNVLMNGTAANNIWKYYAEQTRDERILAYTVELSGIEGGRVKGDLYEMDYPQYADHIKQAAVTAETVNITFQDGTTEQLSYQKYLHANKTPYQKAEIFIAPSDPAALDALLRKEKTARESAAQPYDLKTHINELHDGLIYHEAVRLVSQIAERPNPDSLDKAFFTAEISHHFTMLANSKDYDRLLAALPYRSRGKQLASRPNRSGIYLYVHKDESRDLPAKKPTNRKPSVKSQLKATAPKRGAKPEQLKFQGMEL